MLEKFLDKIEFNGYEEMKREYKVNVPDGFNFAYDIVDAWAEQDQSKLALIWCDDFGNRKRYTFNDIKLLSNKAANFFMSKGIKKGDTVMLILKQRPETWVSFVALHKIGAVCIPATFQLTPKDIIYRCNSAKVKMIVSVDDEGLVDYINEALPSCSTVENYAIVGDNICDGAIDFRKEYAKMSDALERIPNKNSDPMLMYFSSGTTGMPKMILHTYTYPIGHILTAKYWQRLL